MRITVWDPSRKVMLNEIESKTVHKAEEGDPIEEKEVRH